VNFQVTPNEIRMADFINIQGERLDGTNQLTREMALPLVVRGLGAPVEEKLVALGWKGELVVSIVVAMDNQKNKIKGTFFAIHGPICDLTLEADKVWPGLDIYRFLYYIGRSQRSMALLEKDNLCIIRT